MAFCESQWFGGGGTTSTTSTSSGVLGMGSAGIWTSTSSTTFTGINCWGAGGGGTCTTAEYVNFQEMQALQMQHQQSLMQMQMQAQQIYVAQGLHQYAASQMSDDQRRAHQDQAEALQQARLERVKEYEEAGAKAKELLLEHLTPTQKETFNKNKWFVVEGGKSKQQYRIRAEYHTINIEVMDGKKVSHKLCAHVHGSAGVPLHDHILAQKIMLESAEDDFLKIANRHAA